MTIHWATDAKPPQVWSYWRGDINGNDFGPFEVSAATRAEALAEAEEATRDAQQDAHWATPPQGVIEDTLEVVAETNARF